MAASVMRQYDKNKNGVLERDEWQESRDWIKQADLNRDGLITQDELAAKLAEMGRNRGDWGAGGGGDRGPDRRGSAAAGNEGGARKSYRLRTAAERLPKGLPDWFTNRDKDQDGQVPMAEYAQLWSNRMAEEFEKYDLNGDGIITAAEALAFEKKKR
jgi:hypothetical protein